MHTAYPQTPYPSALPGTGLRFYPVSCGLSRRASDGACRIDAALGPSRLPMSERPAPAPMRRSLADLNPRQREAAEYGAGPAGAGPLLVIAGAGSGKTSTLAHRVANLILKGADPRRMLLLTFSRRAAIEMERRGRRGLAESIAAGAGPRAARLAAGPALSTPSARRLLREFAPRIGLQRSPLPSTTAAIPKT